MSMVNGTRFVRSNLMRTPLGATVNVSPPVVEPLTSTSSRPASPLATSVPSPLFQTSVSSPVPPFIVSVPRSPTMRSSPPAPLRTSSPSPPRIRSAPSVPTMVSLPVPPSTDSSVSAPTPAAPVSESSPPSPLTWKRSADASIVNVTRFVRLNSTRPAAASMVNTSPSVGEPLTSTPSLPAPPSSVSELSPLFHTSVSLPASPTRMSTPLPPTRRSLPSPPLTVSFVSAAVRRSSPASPLIVVAAMAVVLASTVTMSFPAPAFTAMVKVPLAATVWSPGVAVSQSTLGAALPAAYTTRLFATEIVSLSSAPSRLSVAVVWLIVAEVTAAPAGTALNAKPAASAVASATAIPVRLMFEPFCLEWSSPPRTPMRPASSPRLCEVPHACYAGPRKEGLRVTPVGHLAPVCPGEDAVDAGVGDVPSDTSAVRAAVDLGAHPVLGRRRGEETFQPIGRAAEFRRVAAAQIPRGSGPTAVADQVSRLPVAGAVAVGDPQIDRSGRRDRRHAQSDEDEQPCPDAQTGHAGSIARCATRAARPG